jgi:uncharacterized protein (TIGR03086 family)
MTDTPALFRAAGQRFGELVHMVGDDQWANPTPCAEWDVRALVNHVHTEVLWIPPLFGGQTVAEVGDRFDGDLLGDDPAAAWDQDIAPATAAIEEPGAMPRSVSLSRGPTPGRDYADELFSDLAIHGWDLAKGIGADDVLDHEWVEVLYAAFKPLEQDLKSYGMYGDMVDAPEGADLQTKLLAVVGRRQDWAAA